MHYSVMYYSIMQNIKEQYRKMLPLFHFLTCIGNLHTTSQTPTLQSTPSQTRSGTNTITCSIGPMRSTPPESPTTTIDGHTHKKIMQQPPGLITQSSPTLTTLPTCLIGWNPDSSQMSIGPHGSPEPNTDVPVLALPSASPQPAPLTTTTNHSQNQSLPSPLLTVPPRLYPSKSPVKPSLPPIPSSPSPFWPGLPSIATLTAPYHP